MIHRAESKQAFDAFQRAPARLTTRRDPLDGLSAKARARLRKAPQPRWVAPMLATLIDECSSQEGWFFEPKLDGERCLVFHHGRALRLCSRNRKLLTGTYPEIAAAFHRQKTDSFIADGEIVAFENGITSFAKLQQRMQGEHPSTASDTPGGKPWSIWADRRVCVFPSCLTVSSLGDNHVERNVPPRARWSLSYSDRPSPASCPCARPRSRAG